MSSRSGNPRQPTVLCVGLALVLSPLVPLATREEAPAPPPRSARLPIENDQVDLGAVLAMLADELGLGGEVIRETISWRVPATGTRGRLALYGIELATLRSLSFDREGDALVATLDVETLRKNEKKLRKRVRGMLASLFPAEAAREAASYGMFSPRPDGSLEPVSKDSISRAITGEKAPVVLVHGINDSGRTWGTLIPHLREAGHPVCVFRYPNDQSIEDSAVFLGRELVKLKSLGPKRLRLVAHSMGGLVCRELLTSPALYGGEGSGGGDFPEVDRLIMIATPNHGSELARYHLLGEWAEQLGKQIGGRGGLLGGFFDGTGEAHVDLLPDSAFLRRLNARPRPVHVTYTIIAGRGSVSGGEILRESDRIVESVFGSKPELMEKYAGLARGLLKSLDGLSGESGDWAVAVESAKLPGVEDFHVFRGNHFSLIRNGRSGSSRLPPAVPVILKRLED